MPGSATARADGTLAEPRPLPAKSSGPIALVDVDHFKAYNDRYGHQAGSLAIQKVANCLRRVVRGRGAGSDERTGGGE